MGGSSGIETMGAVHSRFPAGPREDTADVQTGGSWAPLFPEVLLPP